MPKNSPSTRNRVATVLSYGLAAAFYVGLWGTVLGLALGAAWFTPQGTREFAGIPGWALAGWCAFTALFLVVAQFIGERRRGAGRGLTRAEAPALFDLLERTRQEVGAPPVREIRLKPGPVLGVTRLWRRKRLFVRETKTLVIGLPLLRALSVDELEAALAHELAHFTGGDVRRRRIVNAALGRIQLMRSVLERGSLLLTWLNPLWWLLCGYGAFLRRAAGAIRRVQECRADVEAARVAGAETYARALVRASILSVGFRRMALGIVVRARRADETIDNFFSEFAGAMRDLSADHRERIVRDALREEASGTDEHPPLRRRLEILGIDGPPSLDVPGVPAGTLVADLERIERELTPWAVRGLALGMRARLKRRLGFRRDAAPPEEATATPSIRASSDV